MDAEWDNGVPSDWEGHNSNDVCAHAVPFAIGRLNDPGKLDTLWRYDASGMGQGNDREDNDLESSDEDAPAAADPPSSNGSVRRVRDLSLKCFRGKRVNHFDVSFKQRKIRRPTRMQQPAPVLRAEPGGDSSFVTDEQTMF
jgi:hypothetical protein